MACIGLGYLLPSLLLHLAEETSNLGFNSQVSIPPSMFFLPPLMMKIDAFHRPVLNFHVDKNA
jgi:hypothetical protein